MIIIIVVIINNVRMINKLLLLLLFLSLQAFHTSFNWLSFIGWQQVSSGLQDSSKYSNLCGLDFSFHIQFLQSPLRFRGQLLLLLQLFYSLKGFHTSISR